MATRSPKTSTPEAPEADQRVKLGLKRAKAQGKQLGRPAIGVELERKARRELRKGTGILKVAKMVGLGTGTVHRIKREMNAT